MSLIILAAIGFFLSAAIILDLDFNWRNVIGAYLILFSGMAAMLGLIYEVAK